MVYQKFFKEVNYSRFRNLRWFRKICFVLRDFVCFFQISLTEEILYIIVTRSLLQGMESFIYYLSNIFWKSNISYPLIRIRTCAYQEVRNFSFSRNFVYILNEWPLFWKMYLMQGRIWDRITSGVFLHRYLTGSIIRLCDDTSINLNKTMATFHRHYIKNFTTNKLKYS